jgi:large-conductance mechanosensitive channel
VPNSSPAIVNGSIAVADRATAIAMAQNFSNIIHHNSSHLLPGFPITSSHVLPYYDDTPILFNTNTDTGQGMNPGQIVGMIIGFSIALLCLAICIPLFILFQRRRKREESEQAEKSDKSEHGAVKHSAL